MKKVIFSLWFILSVATLFGSVVHCLGSHARTPIVLPFIPLALISIGVAFLLLFLFRRHLEIMAEAIFTALIAAMAGTTGGILVLEGAHLLDTYPLPYHAAWIVGILFFFAMIFFLRKNLFKGIGITVVLILLGLSVLFIMAWMEQRTVEKTVAFWKSKGFPVQIQEVFPKPSTEKVCQDFFHTLVSIQKDREWENFNRQVISKVLQKTVTALTQGGDLKALLEKLAPDQNPHWETFVKKYNEAVMATLPSCPYILSFDPQKYGENPWKAPLPKLLEIVRWSKGMAVEGLIHARDGNFGRAREQALGILDIAKKLEVPGQFVIANLIAVAMEKLAYMTLVAIQTLEKKPLPQAFRTQILTKGALNPTWAASFMDEEAYSLQKIYKQGTYEEIYGSNPPRKAMLPWKPLQRAIFLNWAKHDLSQITHALTWFHRIPNFQGGKFHWKEAHKDLRNKNEPTYLTSNLIVYMRLLSGVTAYRLLDVVDRIMACYDENQRVPEKIEALPGPLPIDPFTDKPFQYTKLNDRECLIFSPGPDEKPGDPNNLYIFRVLESNDTSDIGYHLIF